MKAILILAAQVVTAAFFLSAQVSVQDIAGDLEGTLHTGADLHLVLHITKGNDGALKATLDSVDQKAYGIPVSSVSLKDSKLALDVAAVHGTYDGKVAALFHDGKLVARENYPGALCGGKYPLSFGGDNTLTPIGNLIAMDLRELRFIPRVLESVPPPEKPGQSQ